MTRNITKRISTQKRLQMQLLERHSRRCIICHHPEREAIEEEFVHWRAPWKIADDFKIADSRTIYRHARATGILLERREGLHSALDGFVEAIDDVKLTGDCILRAMRAYSCIDRHGRWTELPTQVNIATYQTLRPIQQSAANIINVEDADEDTDSNAIDPKLPNRPSRSDRTDCAAPPAQAAGALKQGDTICGSRLQPRHKKSRKRRHTACAATSAQSASIQSKEKSDGRTATDTACAASPAQPAGALKQGETICGSRLQPRHKKSRKRRHTACAASSAQGFGDSPNAASRSDATACAASPAQHAAAPKRSGAIHMSRPQPQPKKASRRKSTASDSFWMRTLDELTRMLAAAKAEAQRPATPVSSPAQAEAEVAVFEPRAANAPVDSPAPAPDVSESVSVPPVTVAPATQPASPPFTAPSAQAFPVQLSHPGPYGMSTGNAPWSPQPEPPNIFTRANLINSSAIKSYDKR